jgi:transcription elongation factor GreA
MAEKRIITYAGLKQLEDELQELKVVRRKEVAQKIKEAREQGDLSENAEYDAAKDEQRDIESRIEEIENILKNVEVIDEDEIDSEVINVGSMITLFDYDYDEEITYHLVGSTEADILNKKISNESPIGIALIGKKVGDEIEVQGQDAIFKYRVLDIKR